MIVGYAFKCNLIGVFLKMNSFGNAVILFFDDGKVFLNLIDD